MNYSTPLSPARCRSASLRKLLLVLAALSCGTIAAADSTAPKGNGKTTDKQPAAQANNPSPKTGETKKPAATKPARKRRLITVAAGEITLDIRQWPLLGKPDAKYVFIEMFDYTCPYCRATHQAVRGAMEHFGDNLAIIALPVPLDSACNRT